MHFFQSSIPLSPKAFGCLEHVSSCRVEQVWPRKRPCVNPGYRWFFCKPYCSIARHVLVFSIKFSPWWILTLCSKVWTFNMSSCPNNCNGHGRCDFSQCVCEPPWPGVLAIQLKRPLKWGARSTLVKDENSIVYILFFTHTYTYSIIIFHLSHTRLYKITYSRFFNEHIDYDGLDQDSSWFTWILPCYCAHRYGADCSLRKCLGTVCYADSSTKDAEEFFSWIFVAKLVIPLSPGAILSWVLFAWQMR